MVANPLVTIVAGPNFPRLVIDRDSEIVGLPWIQGGQVLTIDGGDAGIRRGLRVGIAPGFCASSVSVDGSEVLIIGAVIRATVVKPRLLGLEGVVL
jgi:hypothetical protein